MTADEPVPGQQPPPPPVDPASPLAPRVDGGATPPPAAAGMAGAVDPSMAPPPPADPAMGEHQPPPPAGAPVEISEEAVVALIAERDDYLDQLQRMKAEFANARRRASEQAELVRRQAAADLVGRLLPILDSAQAALDQGVEQVRPLNDALFEVLASQGLALLDPVGQPFDPEQHEAVMFESGDDPAQQEQVVVETMRLGYVWNDRVLRAAMVKVRG